MMRAAALTPGTCDAGSLVFIPQDTLLQSVAHWAAFAACITGFVTLFIGGFVVAAVQEE